MRKLNAQIGPVIWTQRFFLAILEGPALKIIINLIGAVIGVVIGILSVSDFFR